MKRIVTVQDISCVGKCSLTVALPIISSAGVECAVLPTAVLSTHTAFSRFTFRDLTDDLEGIIKHWQEEGLDFDALYTGYLGSLRQIDIVKQMIANLHAGAAAQEKEQQQHNKKLYRALSSNLVVIDPCMADNGSLYKGFDMTFAKNMAELCALADIVVPNITEAAAMLAVPYKAEYDEDYILSLLQGLAKLGAKHIVLKGVILKADTNHFKGVAGKIGVVSYDTKTGTIQSYFHEKLDTSFHGTGDVFASVLVAALVQGVSLKSSYSLAADCVVESIKHTLAGEVYNWYGVDFEKVLSGLAARIQALVPKIGYQG